VRRRFTKSVVKFGSLTVSMPLILVDLRLEEVSGTGSVAVKCIDTTKNIDSEDSLLQKD
jgi:hypothetical protein